MSEKELRPKSEEFEGQQLPYPAKQENLNPQPDSDLSNFTPAGKLRGKTAIITGADSGIGRAVAIAFAMEGADVAIVYNVTDEDAETTRRMVEDKGRRCLVIKADVRDARACQDAVNRTVSELGHLNILINNAAYQMAQKEVVEISDEQFRRTFETNIFGYFYMVRAALPHLRERLDLKISLRGESNVNQTGN